MGEVIIIEFTTTDGVGSDPDGGDGTIFPTVLGVETRLFTCGPHIELSCVTAEAAGAAVLADYGVRR